ncbi:unnamed protein product [Caenorhabditis auriculariae]|uniref:Uncharacterized protein n=1 Tax=Caenorhabditis auriculariae TaxID=2777116 RepID=A0A8S1H2B2_9PELO|nr:unnamed protein product [Caenorhabditis auriculariae]
MEELPDEQFRNNLLEAIYNGNLDELKKVTDGKSEEYLHRFLNEPAEKIPLIVACKKSLFDIARHLINLGADPLVFIESDPKSEKDPETALRLTIEKACARDIYDYLLHGPSFKFLKVLVEEAKINLKEAPGMKNEPPLFIACRQAEFKIFKYLCEQGADVCERNSEGLTLLMKPEFFVEESPHSYHSRNIFNLIIKQGLSVNAVSPTGKTALHYAVESKNLYFMRCLLFDGANVTCDSNNENPLFTVAVKEDEDLFRCLYEHVEDPKTKRDAMLLMATEEFLEGDNFSAVDDFKEAFAVPPVRNEEEVALNPAYDSLREIQSFNDFKDGNERFKFMQCFIIRERILGQGHHRVRDALYNYLGKHLASENYQFRDKAIYCYTLSLFERYPEPLSEPFKNMIDLLYDVLAQEDDYLNSFFPHEADIEKDHSGMVELATHVFHQIHNVLEKCYKEKGERSGMGALRITNTAVELISMIYGFHDMEDERERKRLGIDLPRFIDVADLLHIPLLHSKAFIGDQRLFSLFVNAGANIHGKHWEEQTPLTALTFDRFSVNSENYYFDGESPYDWCDPVRELIHAGSRLFIRDSDDCRVFDSLQNAQKKHKYKDPIVLGKFISLKDMAAEIVEANYSAKYLEYILPRNLRVFLDLKDGSYKCSCCDF